MGKGRGLRDTGEPHLPQPLPPSLPLLRQLHLPPNWTPYAHCPAPSTLLLSRSKELSHHRLPLGLPAAPQANPKPLCGFSWPPAMPSLGPWCSRHSGFLASPNKEPPCSSRCPQDSRTPSLISVRCLCHICRTCHFTHISHISHMPHHC